MYPPTLLAWAWLLLSTTDALPVNRFPTGNDSSRSTSVQFDDDLGMLFKRGPGDDNAGRKPSSRSATATPPTSGPAIIPGTSNFQAVRFNTISVNPPDPSAPKNPQTGGPWQYYPMESYDPQKTTRRYSKKSVKETGTANPVSGETQRPVDPPLMIARRQNPQANRMSGNTVPKRPSPASSSNSITTGNYPTWLNTGDRGIDLKRPPANPPSLIAPPPDLSNFVSMTNPGDQSKSRSRNFHPYPVPETQRPAVKPSSMQPGPSTGPKSGSRPTRGQRLDMLLQQAALSTESSNSDSGKPPGSKSRKFRG